MRYEWLELAKKIQAIAQAGLAYSSNKYDIERYEELRDISVGVMGRFTETEMDKVKELFANEEGYQTPKVDVRGVVFKDHKILMVQEQIDGCWSLPGGWADIGLTPKEVVVKEVKEESGLDVKAARLLAVLDKKCHLHPPSPYHIYKIFILCEIIGGKPSAGMETSKVEFFDRDQLPELSAGRITAEQIKMLFEFLDTPHKEPVLD
ncbi:MAG: NUDIX hydrolase [Firmicutes bacterium]|nr:NUDIX hydrolase [Bacillota bacterium]